MRHVCQVSNAFGSNIFDMLLGLGLRSFSMHPSQILAVKQQVLRADTRKLRLWAQQVIESEDPAVQMAN